MRAAGLLAKVPRTLIGAELEAIYARDGGLSPEKVVEWAAENPESDLHSRFTWDDSLAAHQHRLWQARKIITEVTVIYPDKKTRQVYVSIVESRGNVGYESLVSVMSDKQKRDRFLSQALADYERVGEKYEDLRELAGIRAAVKRVAARNRG